MQLKLTWRVRGRRDMELSVSDGQKIGETMEILTERGLMDEEEAEGVRFVRALRKNNQVSVLLTYREAEIYSGDILVPEEDEEEEDEREGGGINAT